MSKWACKLFERAEISNEISLEKVSLMFPGFGWIVGLSEARKQQPKKSTCKIGFDTAEN